MYVYSVVFAVVLAAACFVLFCFGLFEYPQTNSLLRLRRAQSRTLPIYA